MPLPRIKLFIILVTAMILFSVSGCNFIKQQNSKSYTGASPEQYISTPVYYIKSTQNGIYLVREVHKIKYRREDAYERALDELISGRPVMPDAQRVLPEKTKVLGVVLENNIATVNFSREVLEANVGSEGEALGIQSIVNTLTEFPEIKAVAFKVEGKCDQRVREWWGHVGLYNQPFRRDLSSVREPSLWVTHPVAGQVAGVPLLVKVSALASEGNVNVSLLDSRGKELARETVVPGSNAVVRSEFEVRLEYTPPDTGGGRLEVYQANPWSGRNFDKVMVPIKWQ